MNNFEPLVSIVIPVYNGEKYINQAIDSAINQTYKNIEIIVVNDGSTDNTEEIVKSYGDKVRYFYKENGGVSSALNLGIKESKGEYISWLSHDDLYYPHKIEKQIEELKDTENKNNAIIFSAYDIYIENTRKFNKKLKEKIIHKLENLDITKESYTFNIIDILFSSSFNFITFLIPKELFYKISFFDETKKTTQDYFLILDFLKYGVKFNYVNLTLAMSRLHKNQGTRALYDEHIKELYYLFKCLFKQYENFFKTLPLWKFSYFLNIINNRTLSSVYTYMLSEWCNGDWNKDKPIIWMYWENKKAASIPEYIKLSWETIIKHNKYDFQIKILNEYNVYDYLPNLNKNCFLYKEIAHRADYIRFNLLYEYGGIWLDSDTVIFSSLSLIKEKIKQYNFVCTGYVDEETNEYFIIINFLASNKKNEICLKVIEYIEDFLNTKLINNIEQEWDYVGNYLSSMINSQYKERCFIYPAEYFYPYPLYDPINNKKFENIKYISNDIDINKAFGQALANSARSREFKNYKYEELIFSDKAYSKIFLLGLDISIKPYDKNKLVKNFFKPSILTDDKYISVYFLGIRITFKKRE